MCHVAIGLSVETVPHHSNRFNRTIDNLIDNLIDKLLVVTRQDNVRSKQALLPTWTTYLYAENKT